MVSEQKYGIRAQDPYWTPPPGRKLGDNLTHDPVCAREIKELKEEIAKLKKCEPFLLFTILSFTSLAHMHSPLYLINMQLFIAESSLYVLMFKKGMNMMENKKSTEENLALAITLNSCAASCENMVHEANMLLPLKLGDNPTQDLVCGRKLRELREEIAKLKKYEPFILFTILSFTSLAHMHSSSSLTNRQFFIAKTGVYVC
ncbi:hypothetical protein V6N13_109182 [Hibiscus sabdariffa]